MKGDEPKASEQLTRLVQAIGNSSKYSHVCDDLIVNIGIRELTRHKSYREALKSTKNKLHQVAGAYFVKRPNYNRWLEELKDARRCDDDALFKERCTKIMSLHHSSRERLKELDAFYAGIFSSLPPIGSVLDIACGLNPLSIPWMPLRPDARYYACDIYHDLVDFLNEYMDLLSVQGEAEIRDVTQHPPEMPVDLALILLSIPCLEQIDRSAGEFLLKSNDARFLAVSFPVRSLGGNPKGMRGHYTRRLYNLVKGRGWDVQELDFNSERVFIIRK